MKRWLCVLLTLSLFLLSACGGEPDSQQVTVENGAFTCEPQQIIDAINLAIQNDGSGQFYTCDPFVESGESIFTSDDWSHIILSFDTADSGFITHCRLYWLSGDFVGNVIATAGLYSTVILDTLSADNSDDILDSINSIVIAGEGSASFDANGVAVEFQSIGGKNWLDISVSG